MFKIFAIGTALLIAYSAASAAQPDTFYAGADVGRTHISEFSQSYTTFGIFGGYNFHRNIAAEVGFRRLAEFETFGARVSTDQLSVSLVGSLPLSERISVYGRLGLNSLEVTAGAGGWSGRDTEIKALYGIGIKYAFDAAVSFRVEVQRPVNEMTNLSVGISYQF